MKKVLFSLFLVITVKFVVYSQTTISVTNGSWNNPLTWSCTCVPMPGSNVTIEHTITLPNSYTYTSGSITINQNGVLQQTLNNDLWVNGGDLTNHGEIKMRYLWTQTGDFVNDGVVHVNSFLNNVPFTNEGTFEEIDSIYTTADIINNGNFIDIDSMTNDGIFINNGLLLGNAFTNNNKIINNNVISLSDITNFSFIENYDSIQLTYSAWNLGKWVNHPNSFSNIGKSILNNDVINNSALLNNNGILNIGDSFYNMDSIVGSNSGYISVQDSSYNSGIMIGDFDFCDYTQPANASQIVDFNINGTISSSITFCSQSGLNKIKNSDDIIVYPNPFDKNIYINIDLPNEYSVCDQSGKIIKYGKDVKEIDLSSLTQGTYIINIKNNEIFKSILITK